MNNTNTRNSMRVYHRYLGFFLAGVMIMYAISGIVLIFRQTNFLKQQKVIEKTLPKNIETEKLGKELKIKNFEIIKTEGSTIYFKQGTFNTDTGIATYAVKELPYILNKMTKIHKATTNSPLFFLNIFFGISLLFFVVSSFWMFMPSSDIFKKGLYFSLGGIILVFILLFV